MPKKTFNCWCNKATRKPQIIAACKERGIQGVDFKRTSRFALLEMWRETLAEGYANYISELDTVGRDNRSRVGSNGQD